jgi:hypothetical protein
VYTLIANKIQTSGFLAEPFSYFGAGVLGMSPILKLSVLRSTARMFSTLQTLGPGITRAVSRGPLNKYSSWHCPLT